MMNIALRRCRCFPTTSRLPINLNPGIQRSTRVSVLASFRHACTEKSTPNLAPDGPTTPGTGSDEPATLSLPTSPTVPAPDPPNLDHLTPKPTNHHDLASFLQYADRTGLDQGSTVFVGTHFEYTVASTLSLYGFNLHRIGGASDAGIDLLGTWKLPASPSPSPPSDSPLATTTTIRVILQCKVTAAPRPALIRELEGAFIGAPPGWKTGAGGSSPSQRVMGFLVAHKPATKGIRDALGRSRWPMGYIFCSREGVVEQMLWNQRAVEQGLEGVGVVKRYGVGEGGQQVALTVKGRTLPFVGGGDAMG